MTSYLIEEALYDCERALERPEKWFTSCTVLSNIFANEGLRQASYLWHSLGQQKQPSRLSFHVLAASTYARLKNWKKALSQNQKALAVDRDLAIAYFNLAHIYEQLGEKEKGQDYLYRFMMLRPEQASGKTCESLGLALLQRGEQARAVQCYLWAIQNDPDLWSAYYRLAHAMVESDQSPLAIYSYRQLLQRDPKQVEARQKLGMLLLNEGEQDAAIQQFRQAIKSSPTFIWPYLSLVRVLTATRQWDEVIATSHAALENAQQDLPWAYRSITKALIAKGESSKTDKYHQKICKLEGWEEAEKNNYYFTYDTLTHQIAPWKNLLKPLATKLSAQEDAFHVIEVGSGQGMRSCWLLDHCLTSTSTTLTCIDQTFTAAFQANISKSESLGKVIQLKGDSTNLLSSLEENTYNVAILQDRQKDAEQVYQVAKASWPLLKGGAIVFFGNCDWKHPQDPAKSTRVGVERFLQEYGRGIKILSNQKNVWIQKL